MAKINLILEPNEEGRLIYYPGTLLKGTVELLIVDNPMTIGGFYVTVFGQAQTNWSESRSRSVGVRGDRRTEHYTVNFEAQEVYLNSRTYLLGQHNGTSFEVQPGNHKYMFTYQLPDGLPYTVELKYGSVRYYAEAVIDIPWGLDEKFKMPFSIIRHDDLNIYPELRFAQNYEEFKTFCCYMFCESGNLHMTVSIPYSGFAVGQSVPITISYDNKSDTDVTSTIIQLKRSIEFTSQTPESQTRSEREVVVEHVADGNKAGEFNEIKAELVIPQTLLSSNGNFCQIVTISYSVEVAAEVSGCHMNPWIKFPVVIGTIPIESRSQYITSAEPNVSFSQPTVPQISTIQHSTLVAEPSFNDAPPSFEEAMKMPKPFMTSPSPSNSLNWIVTPTAPAFIKQ